MSTVLCCSSIAPYRPRLLDHEAKFTAFMNWASLQTTLLTPTDDSFLVGSAPYAIQLVKQINYGPQESIRYFFLGGKGTDFTEATECSLIKSNLEKLNSFKNFKCEQHNRFFEVNLYQKNPVNAHHWRVNLARPSRDIDLTFRSKDGETGEKVLQSAEQDGNYGLQASSPELYGALSQASQGVDESILQKSQPANQQDIANVLRFLLPKIETNLGASRLLSLFCLDWANTELALGLEFETLWRDELTSSNFIIFFCDSFVSNAPDGEVDVADIEGLVTPAMQVVKSSYKAQLSGRARFHEIVTTVLEIGRTQDWVSMCEGSITRLIISGPDEKLLEHCRLQDVRLQQNRSDRGIEEVAGNQIEKSDEESGPSWDYDNKDEDHYDDEDCDDRDLTACDKECGYCGKCDY